MQVLKMEGGRVEHHERLRDAPLAVQRAAQAVWAELGKREHYAMGFLTGEEQALVLCWDDKLPGYAGILLFSEVDEGDGWWVDAVYVEQLIRGGRRHELLWRALTSLAALQPGVKYIDSLVAVDNEAALKAVQRMRGRKLTHHKFRYEVPRG